jgi:uncharacterized protein YraI
MSAVAAAAAAKRPINVSVRSGSITAASPAK